MLDFDQIDIWFPSLTNALSPIIDNSVLSIVANSNPEFFEDALDQLLESVDRNTLVDTTLNWLQLSKIVGYHGTRLTKEEALSISNVGLRPLSAPERRVRLTRALSKHHEWHEKESRLDEAIENFGKGNSAGQREGQVHLTLSEAGMLRSFNHYLKYGSEFDQHAAYTLFGTEGYEYLARDGTPMIFRFSVPGETAIRAAHPIFTVDDMLARNEMPNIVKEFLNAWCFRLTDSSFQTTNLREDCGLVFRDVVPAEWIIGIRTVQIEEICA